MSAFFQPRKRKTGVIILNDSDKTPAEKKQKVEYEKKIQTNGFNVDNLNERILALSKKPLKGKFIKLFVL